MTPEHLLARTDTMGACVETLARHEWRIVWMAEWIARGDPVLADDLAQVARITLWDLDPSRFAERDGGYLVSAIRFAMLNEVTRRQYPLLAPERRVRVRGRRRSTLKKAA